MNTDKNIFREFDQLIRNKYEEIPIYSLEDKKFEDEHPLTFFSNATRESNLKPGIKPTEIYQDLSFMSKDLKYFIGSLFFFRPYINKPVKEEGTYFQTIEDSRYLTYVNTTFQWLYNFWDRIADFLHIYLKIDLAERDVYINRVIDILRTDYSNSTYAQNLVNIYDKELHEIFKERIQIVHYKSIDTKFYLGLFRMKQSKDNLKSFQKEKEKFPEYFNEQQNTTFDGFENAVKLVKTNSK